MQEWWHEVVKDFYKCFIRDDRYKMLLGGIGVTLEVSLVAVIIGLLIGLLIALCNLSKKKPLMLILPKF